MQIAGMILGCLLLGQGPDALLSGPTALEKKSPAVLEPTIKAAAEANDAAPGVVGQRRAGPADAIKTAADANDAATGAVGQRRAGPADAIKTAVEAPEVVTTVSAQVASGLAPHRPHPPEMIANAIVLPPGSTLSGQPWTLLSVLAATSDRRQQLELTRAYWHMVQAVAEYHFCLDHAQKLASTKPGGDEAAAGRLAQASAVATLHQAELEATRAQYELARLLRLPTGAPLPLPADRPHVGAYQTKFQALFAGRTPPEPAALMERILPIRRQAIDEQAAAVQAAEDVLAAATDPQQDRRGDAANVTACSRELLRQQRAFVRTVCDYNVNIAEYALVVTGPAVSPQALVAILIVPAPQVAASTGAVQAAGASLPIADATRQAARDGWKTTGPTLAPSRNLASPGDAVTKNEPTLAPPRDGLQPAGKNEPTLAPPRAEANKEPTHPETKPTVPVERPDAAPSLPQPRTANKPVLAASSAPVSAGEARDGKASLPAASPLYAALLEATPGARAKQLTIALHWDRSLPPGIGKPLNLLDCLLRDSGTDRQATIDAFWRARQRAAEYQVLAQQVELLEALAPVALERRNEPSGAVEMLRLRRAQTAAQASLREAHVALIEAQYALALRLGATEDSDWPLASTVPHAGKYLLMLEGQPPAVAQSWPVRRLAATIPSLGENVEQHAAAVVEADAARVAAAERYFAGRVAIDPAIEGVATQTRQTQALLETLTEYNRAIAEYALTVLPPATAADRLVAALVVKP